MNQLEVVTAERRSTEIYGADEGRDVAINAINELLKKKDLVVVAMHGASRNVGKTTLGRQILKAVSEEGVRVWQLHDSEELKHMQSTISQESQEGSKLYRKTVFLFGEEVTLPTFENTVEDVRTITDKRVARAFQNIGLDVGGVDLWIAIDKPSGKFSGKNGSGSNIKPLGDIWIRNEKATDKNKI